MKTKLLVAGIAILLSSCATTTTALVPTPKGTYRFYQKPFNNDTFVELCVEEPTKTACRDVKISISFL